MIFLFCGFDEREGIGFHVFVRSVIARASKPVAIIPLSSMGLPQGSNTFTMSRFMVPDLMNYQGHAIFADASDMLCLGDVAELDAMFDPKYAVQVVKHPSYKTRHRVKYRGTSMECPNTNYDRKNWASIQIFNCAHPAWQNAGTPLSILDALQFKFLADEDIGEISSEWNRIVDEGQPIEGAKLLHYTAGIPGFAAYKETPGAKFWHRERKAMEACE